MARTKKTLKYSKPCKKESIKKKCSACPPDSPEQPLKNFYKSSNDLNSDGYLSVCKECIVERCYDGPTDEVDVEAFKAILRQLDKPYITTIYQASVSEYDKKYPKGTLKPKDKSVVIGFYFKNISTLSQFKKMNWVDGLEWEKRAMIKNGRSNSDTRNGMRSGESSQDDELYFLEDDDFEVTENIIHLFGEGYKKSEYRAMWKKYAFLKDSYPSLTNLHSEALFTYIRFKVKEENATAIGDVVEAEKWNKAATNAAAKAKINPSQLSKSDLQGGLNSFSELLQAVEQHEDFIPILPKFRFQPNDAIDFNIWCLINYIRRLEDKPLCEYEEVYKFYDDRKLEYIEQYGDPYGIFIDDPTESNRKNIKKFISLPNDYVEQESSLEGDDESW